MKALPISFDITDWTKAERHRLLQDMLGQSSVSDREKTLLFCRHWLGMTLRETGVVLGVQQERVRQLEQRAFRKLRYAAVKIHAVEVRQKIAIEPAGPSGQVPYSSAHKVLH